MADLSGTTLDGKYELSQLLGEGGMGSVYEATHTLIGRRLAVKFLHSQYVTSDEVVTRFQREAQAAAAIGHENIIEVTDMGKTPDGAPYIVMEYLDGMDLKELLTEKGTLTSVRIAHIMMQALSALHAAHEVGIIHRDLKPENIYLIEKPDRPDYVKLLDFGISKFRSLEAEGAKGLTQTGTVLGTPYYMSPEQARGDQDLSARSDIYAMGVILYQMLTGNLPFDAPNYNALLIKILTEEPVSPSEINPDIPPELEEACKIAMDRAPGNRFADCIEFRQRLKPFAPGSSAVSFETGLSPASRAVVAAAISTPTETPLEMTRSGLTRPPKRKLPLIIGGVAAAAVAAMIGILASGTGGDRDKAPAIVPTSVATSTTDKPTKPKPKPAPESKDVLLEIAANPATAVIKVDGKIVEGNPFKGSFSMDQALHQVDITAEGYKTEAASIRFDKDQKLSYKLTKAKSEDSASDKKSKSSSKSKKSVKSKKKSKRVRITKKEEAESKADKPKKGKKPRRKIDDEDPWN
ncbi:MAG: serine/threonine protein kinase [Deltaproteobacteria bacterium]|nr:serine/threonine protein kinase [Deltaproteobacteria bacterium]